MRVKFKARCERVRPNNGIVEVLFTRRELDDQEEHVLVNVKKTPSEFIEGREYLIEIQPAFPH